MGHKEAIQLKAQEIYEVEVERQLDRGATDNQAYDKARTAADEYADAMYRLIKS